MCVYESKNVSPWNDLMDWSPPGFSIHWILQARMLEWVAISSSRGSFQPRDWTWVSHVAGRFFTIWATREAYTYMLHVKSLQSCLTLCDPVDSSPPGSSIHGILQAGILEWVTMPSSRGSSWPRDWTHISYGSSIGRQVLYHQHIWEAIYVYVYICIYI